DIENVFNQRRLKTSRHTGRKARATRSLWSQPRMMEERNGKGQHYDPNRCGANSLARGELRLGDLGSCIRVVGRRSHDRPRARDRKEPAILWLERRHGARIWPASLLTLCSHGFMAGFSCSRPTAYNLA